MCIPVRSYLEKKKHSRWAWFGQSLCHVTTLISLVTTSKVSVEGMWVLLYWKGPRESPEFHHSSCIQGRVLLIFKGEEAMARYCGIRKDNGLEPADIPGEVGGYWIDSSKTFCGYFCAFCRFDVTFYINQENACSERFIKINIIISMNYNFLKK